MVETVIFKREQEEKLVADIMALYNKILGYKENFLSNYSLEGIIKEKLSEITRLLSVIPSVVSTVVETQEKAVELQNNPELKQEIADKYVAVLNELNAILVSMKDTPEVRAAMIELIQNLAELGKEGFDTLHESASILLDKVYPPLISGFFSLAKGIITPTIASIIRVIASTNPGSGELLAAIDILAKIPNMVREALAAFDKAKKSAMGTMELVENTSKRADKITQKTKNAVKSAENVVNSLNQSVGDSVAQVNKLGEGMSRVASQVQVGGAPAGEDAADSEADKGGDTGNSTKEVDTSEDDPVSGVNTTDKKVREVEGEGEEEEESSKEEEEDKDDSISIDNAGEDKDDAISKENVGEQEKDADEDGGGSNSIDNIDVPEETALEEVKTDPSVVVESSSPQEKDAEESPSDPRSITSVKDENLTSPTAEEIVNMVVNYFAGVINISQSALLFGFPLSNLEEVKRDAVKQGKILKGISEDGWNVLQESVIKTLDVKKGGSKRRRRKRKKRRKKRKTLKRELKKKHYKKLKNIMKIHFN